MLVCSGSKRPGNNLPDIFGLSSIHLDDSAIEIFDDRAIFLWSRYNFRTAQQAHDVIQIFYREAKTGLPSRQRHRDCAGYLFGWIQLQNNLAKL